MKLLTKELIKRFEQVGSQEEVEEKIAIVKFFNPAGAGNWFATEYDPIEKMFFGYVSIFGDWNDEWGYFSLAELEGYKGKFGLGIERDMSFKETSMTEIIKRYTGGK
jgi:hypothetical protein